MYCTKLRSVKNDLNKFVFYIMYKLHGKDRRILLKYLKI